MATRSSPIWRRSSLPWPGIGREHEMRRSFAFLTSENYFSLMGVQPFRGRFYNAEECRPNANIPVVVASYGFWKRMGARNDFVGSTLQINGAPYTVIGIAPDGFSGASALIAPEIWLPLGIRSQLGSAFGDSETMHDLMNPKNYAFNLTGRMRSGLTIETAKSRLPVLAQRLTAIQPPGTEGTRELQVQKPSRFSLSTQPENDGPVTLIATLLLCMAGAVLLIACLNLANMLLARGTARAKEIALRLALGASRWRIVRQLLCEGLLLALCGGAVGLFISAWCNDLLLHSLASLLASVTFSFVVKLSPDATVLAVTFLFCLLATMFFSLGPALKAAGPIWLTISNSRSANRRGPVASADFSRRVIFRSWRRSRSRSCCFSRLDYFSGARSRPRDSIPVSSRPAIWSRNSISA